MIKSLHHLYSFLNSTSAGLDKIIDQIEISYTPKSEPKTKYGRYQRDNHGRIKYRDLLVPVPCLKATQQRINYLLQKVSLPDYMYGSIPNKNHLMNAQQHLNQTYFLTIDLKKFFPNINHYQVHQMFLNNGFSYSTSHLLTKLATFNGSLPQGGPSSPVIANLVFLDTAKQLFKFTRNHKITYTNYLDDQSFSSTKDFKEFVPQILEMIKQNKFYPSHDKIHYRIHSCEITGLMVSGNRLYLMPEMRKEAQKNIKLKPYIALLKKYNQRTLKINKFILPELHQNL